MPRLGWGRSGSGSCVLLIAAWVPHRTLGSVAAHGGRGRSREYVMLQTRGRRRDGEIKDTSWVKVFAPGLQLLLGWNLTLVEWRVLLHLVSLAKAGTNVAPGARAAKIAADLGHDRTTVARALAVLQGMGVIRLRREDSGARVAEVNPYVAFRGDSRERGVAIEDGRWYVPVNTKGVAVASSR